MRSTTRFHWLEKSPCAIATWESDIDDSRRFIQWSAVYYSHVRILFSHMHCCRAHIHNRASHRRPNEQSFFIIFIFFTSTRWDDKFSYFLFISHSIQCAGQQSTLLRLLLEMVLRDGEDELRRVGHRTLCRAGANARQSHSDNAIKPLYMRWAREWWDSLEMWCMLHISMQE